MAETATQPTTSREEIERSLRLVRASTLLTQETRQSSLEIIEEALSLVDQRRMELSQAAQLTMQVMSKVLSEIQLKAITDGKQVTA